MLLKYCFLLLFILMTLCSKNNELVKEKYDDGKIYKKYHVIEKQGKKIKHGSYKSWHKNGNKQAKLFFHHDKMQGKNIMYHENGAPHVVGNYINGELDGICEIYYESGKIEREETYKSDIKEGKSLSWYENGNKKALLHFKKGIMHGEAKTWFENGQIGMHAYYNNAKLDGEAKTWHESGEMNIISKYSQGKIVSIDSVYKKSKLQAKVEVQSKDIKTESVINLKFEKIGYFKGKNKLRYLTFYVKSSETLNADSIPVNVFNAIKKHGSKQMNTSGQVTASFYYVNKSSAPDITAFNAFEANNIAHERKPIASVWILPTGKINLIKNPE